MDSKNVFVPELGVARANTFSAIYPEMNNYIFSEKDYQPSRDGDVKEMMDVKTHILNPYRRCVGGYERNANIFFLLAEAMWIALGKKDVQFLTFFNKKMAEYSDDGETFHAPYGYRLRHWGIRTEDKFVEDGLGASKGYDQVIDAIKILAENPNTRQVVMEIWNPNFDLGYKTKDIPCNDIVMLKIRNGKLITTIGNRSNDLHLGLPTNVFQFSFLTELIAGALGIELGTQTHNSQSLHIYSWNKTAEVMDKIYVAANRGVNVVGDMYTELGVRERRIDFHFSHEVPVNRFREIECNLNIIIDNLTKIATGGEEVAEEIHQLADFSNYLHISYQLMKIFLGYKANLGTCTNDAQRDASRYSAMADIEVLESSFNMKDGSGSDFLWDISTLAKNFFATRLSKKMDHEFLGKL